jgi:hypothetical protein
MFFGFLAAASCSKNSESMESLGAVIAWTIVGFPIGIALGLLVFRKVFKVGGSLVFGIAGGVVGVLLLLLLAEPLHLNIYTDALVIVFVLVPPAIATAGYFYKILWRKKKISTPV